MARSIEDRASFNLIRYANCWEDADILCQALQPGPGKRFLSIASAGDNSFSILSHGAQVVAVDLSQAQLACVELRKASFANLGYKQLLGFFGVTEHADRQSTFQKLRKDLTVPTREFWDAKADTIRAGFIHEGKFEAYFKTFRTRVLPLVHSKKRIQHLLIEKSPQDRLEFYNRKWNTWRWRMMFRVFFSRFVMGRLGRDPEFFRFVEGSVASRILKRTEHAVTKLETHNNPYMTYILTGNYHRESLPHYLRPKQFDTIRNNLENLTLVELPVDQAAKSFGQQGFDGYNLSDIFEYLAPNLCEKVYSSILECARPNSRIAYWNMLVPRTCPESLRPQVNSLTDLADKLFQQDKAWFYSKLVIEETCN